MVQAVMCLPDTAVLRVRFQTSACVESGSGTGVSASTSVATCQYLSTNAPYSFIHLSAMLYNLYQLSASLNNTIQTTI